MTSRKLVFVEETAMSVLKLEESCPIFMVEIVCPADGSNRFLLSHGIYLLRYAKCYLGKSNLLLVQLMHN